MSVVVGGNAPCTGVWALCVSYPAHRTEDNSTPHTSPEGRATRILGVAPPNPFLFTLPSPAHTPGVKQAYNQHLQQRPRGDPTPIQLLNRLD